MTKALDNLFKSPTKTILALILPALILYFRSLKFEFTGMDEQWMIIQSASFLENFENIKSVFSSAIAEVYYRPLFSVSLFVDYHFGKLSPNIYHFTNLILHLLSVFLMYQFLLLEKVEKRSAFILSLLFSIHPLALHAVAWIPGRNDSMLCIFFIASLIYLLKFISTTNYKFIFLHLLFLAGALFTKETAIVFPLIYLSFMFNRTGIKTTLLLAIFWIGVCGIWLVCRHNFVAHVTHTPIDYLNSSKNTLLSFLVYLGKTIFPVELSVYPLLKNASLLPGIFSLILLNILSFKLGFKNKNLAFTGLFIYVLILVIPIVYSLTGGGEQQYEHRAYTAMLGMALFLSQIKFNALTKYENYLIGIIFLFFFSSTYVRMNVYKNSISFIETAIQEAPDQHYFYHQKGDYLNHKKDFEGAILNYKKSISLRPTFGESYSNMGIAHLSLGSCKEAILDFNNAIKYSKFDETNYYNRCIAYNYCADPKNAMKDLIILKKCCPQKVSIKLEKEVTTHWTELIRDLEKQSLAEPENPQPYYESACMFFDVEMNEQGLENLKMALKLDPSNEEYKQLLSSHLDNSKN